MFALTHSVSPMHGSPFDRGLQGVVRLRPIQRAMTDDLLYWKGKGGTGANVRFRPIADITR